MATLRAQAKANAAECRVAFAQKEIKMKVKAARLLGGLAAREEDIAEADTIEASQP